MDATPGLLGSAALALGASWASGLNAYAVIALLGLGSWFGMVTLPAGLEVLANPLVVGVAALLYLVEFVVDKVPGADTVWDGVQTFVRVPAGAFLASGALASADPALGVVGALIGGSLAGATHATKASGRVMLNTVPVPGLRAATSVTEDAAAVGALWLALNNPWVVIGLVAASLVLMAWLLPKLWRGVVALFQAIGRLFGRRPAPVAAPAGAPVAAVEPEPEGPPVRS